MLELTKRAAVVTAKTEVARERITSYTELERPMTVREFFLLQGINITHTVILQVVENVQPLLLADRNLGIVNLNSSADDLGAVSKVYNFSGKALSEAVQVVHTRSPGRHLKFDGRHLYELEWLEAHFIRIMDEANLIAGQKRGQE